MKQKARILTAEPGKQELVLAKEFNAPRELVFKAYTDPSLYVKWIGPRRLSTTIEAFTARNGGSWRFIQKDKDGNEYAFHGVFHEVLVPSRIITTWEFEGLPESGHVSLQSATFENLPGRKTRFTAKVVYLSLDDRDGELQAGMEEGLNESYERLDGLLDELKKG